MARPVRLSHEGVLLGLVLFLAVFLSVLTEGFLSPGNVVDVLVATSVNGMLAAGLVVVLVSGGIDISFTATATIAQYVAGLALLNTGAGWVEIFLISGTIGLALGAGNAVLIYYLKVSPIIVTIATLNLYFGTMMAVTSGTWLYGFPTWFSEGLTLVTLPVGGGDSITIGLPIVALGLTWLATYLLLEKTSVGRGLYALGSNEDAARRIGFPIFRLYLLAYGFMGLVAGLASVVQAQITQTVAPTSFVGGELAVLAAVVLGGASLTGGAGSMKGTILGVLFIAILQNGLTLLAVSSYLQPLLLGLVIVVSVTVNAMRQSTKGAAA